MSSLPDTYSTALGELGLEEVEPWIVEDTYENRRVLRGAKYQWDVVTDSDGLPTGLIRAFSASALTERRESVWVQRRPIMEDPENPWSDYLSPLDYPMDADVPMWVRNRARRWLEQKDEGTPEPTRELLPFRCTLIRQDGTRCWNWVSRKKVDRCKQHLSWSGNNEQARVATARLRIAQASLRAVEVLEELQDTASGEAVRLKAAESVLDRAGVRGGTELDVSGRVEHVDTSEEVRTRLSRLAERLDEERKRHELEASDVVDAEVVEDENRDHDSGDPADPGAGVVAGES